MSELINDVNEYDQFFEFLRTDKKLRSIFGRIKRWGPCAIIKLHAPKQHVPYDSYNELVTYVNESFKPGQIKVSCCPGGRCGEGDYDKPTHEAFWWISQLEFSLRTVD